MEANVTLNKFWWSWVH